MLFELRPFGDPATEQFFLLRLQRLVRIGRRHQLAFVLGEDAANGFALVGLARHDRQHAARGFLHRVFATIETQIGLARARSVTMPTGVGQDRTNVAIEANRLDGRMCYSATSTDGGDESERVEQSGSETKPRRFGIGQLTDKERSDRGRIGRPNGAGAVRSMIPVERSAVNRLPKRRTGRELRPAICRRQGDLSVGRARLARPTSRFGTKR